MPTPDLTSSEAYLDLLTDVRLGDVEPLLRTLYGPEWRDSIVGVARDLKTTRYVARRHPKPLRVVDFVAPIASGLIAHDGRPARSRVSRTAGWWTRPTTSDAWTESATTSIVRALRDAVEGLVREARARFDALGGSFAASEVETREWSEAGRLLAALGSLLAMLDGGPSRVGETFHAMREDDRFALPDEDLGGMLREWLAEAAAAHDWRPGRKVAASRIFAAYEADGAPGGFLKQEFFRRLDAVIGPRRKYEYRLPADLFGGEPED